MKYAGLWLPGWLIHLAIADWIDRRVPNRSILIGLVFASLQNLIYQMQGLIGWRNYYLLVVVWIGSIVLWLFSFWGGGDAKFMIVLVLALPFYSLVFLQVIALLITVLWQLAISKTGERRGAPAVTLFAVAAVAWYCARFVVTGML